MSRNAKIEHKDGLYFIAVRRKRPHWPHPQALASACANKQHIASSYAN
jgi:hypothetical protein